MERLDAPTPEARDAAEMALRDLGSAAARPLLAFLEDPRPEVRARVARLLSTAPMDLLLGELLAGRKAVAQLLAPRVPAPSKEQELWNELCARHASPEALAIQFSARHPVVLFETARAADLLLELSGGAVSPSLLASKPAVKGVRWAFRDGVLAAGSDVELEAWNREPALAPAFRDLAHADAGRRELAARSAGRAADLDLLRVWARLAAEDARARETLVWALLARGRVDLPEARKALEEALVGPPGRLAAAACSVFRSLPFGPDPARLRSENRETRYLVFQAFRAWDPALLAGLEDVEPEIRLSAYQQIHFLAPRDALPWKELLKVRRELPQALAARAYSFNPDLHPATETPLFELLGAEEVRDRIFAVGSLLSSNRGEVVDRVLDRLSAERDPAVLAKVVGMARFPAVRDRRKTLDFLLERAKAGDASAVHPFGQSEEPRALEHLEAIADHAREDVRKAVVSALWIWKRKDERAIARLEDRSTAETSAEIRGLIQKALEPPAGGGSRFRGVGTLSCWACGHLPAGVHLEIPSFASSWR